MTGARKSSTGTPALHAALAKVAPGTPLRDGIDRIVRAKMGAIVVIGDGPDVLAICSGGFLLDAPYSPQRLSELAKMDGAIILDADGTRIARANVHLVPDPTVGTSETGTRHRTAERVARSLRVPVVSISEEMGVINVYTGDTKHQVQEVPRLLNRANQALQTLERYKERLDDAIANLTALEVEDLVTLRDVATVVQRGEMVHRVADEIETAIIELGVEARLLRLQLDELYGEIDDELDLVLADYVPDRCSVTDIRAGVSRIGDDDLLDLRQVAAALQLPGGGADLDMILTARGLRLVSRVSRLPTDLVARVVDHFGELSKLQRATVPDLVLVDGIDEQRARALREGLARLTENTILEQF